MLDPRKLMSSGGDQREEAATRSLLALVGAVAFLDMLFYTALAPLLPTYADEMGLSKSQGGLLQAAYAAGILVFALPCGWLAARVGVRRATTCGLLLLAVASVAFGFARSVVVLDLARVLQGASGACSWAGGLAWLVAAAPAHRRGALVGTALGVSLLGALGGPVLGAFAQGLGPEVVFTLIAATALMIAGAAQRLPAPAPQPVPAPRELLHSAMDGGIATAAALLVLFGVACAAVGTLVPLRLDELGGGAALIAGTFLAAAAVEAWANPLSGRVGDRNGDRLAPVRLALPVTALGLLLLAAATNAVAVAVLTVLTIAAAGVIFTPVSTLLGDRAEARGLPLPMAYALLNFTWAIGSVVGASGGGALAQAHGDAVVYALVAALSIAVAAAITAVRPARPRTAAAAA